MKHLWLGVALILAMGSAPSIVFAETSLQALENELKEVKRDHDEVTTKILSDFYEQVDAAMVSAAAAAALYNKAGGTMPPATAVSKRNENETPTERDHRLAQDQINANALGGAVQVHCGLLHYAAHFIIKPDEKGLKADFEAWLVQAAEAYPGLGLLPDGGGQGSDTKRKIAGHAPFNLDEIKGQTMHDSVIARYLQFKAWDDKPEGKWSIREIPKLYRAEVLEPLRSKPTAKTLMAWKPYLAMASADETDDVKWGTTTYPPLEFEMACDDYAARPGEEKLEAIVKVIKDNPTHAQADEWITRAHALFEDYRAKHGGAAPVLDKPAPSPTSTNDPHVSVTTETQGDATIITTRTNSAVATPPPPGQ